MVTFLTIVHIFVCLFLILTVLLQAGKGGGMGVALGGGGSQTVFGSSGAGNFLTRLTSITAAVFMVTSLGLAHYSSQQDSRRLRRIEAEQAEQKKTDEVKIAQRKAELEKSRPAVAAGGAGALPASEGLSSESAAGAVPSEKPAPAPAAETKPAEKAAPTTAPRPKAKKIVAPAAPGATAPAAPAPAPAAPVEAPSPAQ